MVRRAAAYHTIREIAALCGVTETFINQAIESGRIPHTPTVRGKLVPASAVNTIKRMATTSEIDLDYGKATEALKAKDVWTPSELTDILGVSDWMIRSQANAGHLTNLMPEGAYAFTREEVNRWIRTREFVKGYRRSKGITERATAPATREEPTEGAVSILAMHRMDEAYEWLKGHRHYVWLDAKNLQVNLAQQDIHLEVEEVQVVLIRVRNELAGNVA